MTLLAKMVLPSRIDIILAKPSDRVAMQRWMRRGMGARVRSGEAHGEGSARSSSGGRACAWASSASAEHWRTIATRCREFRAQRTACAAQQAARWDGQGRRCSFYALGHGRAEWAAHRQSVVRCKRVNAEGAAWLSCQYSSEPLA